MGARLLRFSSETEGLIYGALTEQKLEWKKLSTLAQCGAISMEDANALLTDFERRGAVRRAAHVLEKEDLWGATCVVGVLPRPG